MLKMRFALLLSATMVLSLSAFAVDGVVLINQATVNASGGFPYKITKAGSYRLSSNLIVPAGKDGIDIMADNVGLDLNGFTILGPGTCTGRGATLTCSGNSGGTGVSSSNNNVSVRNGFVRGMGNWGVSINGRQTVVEEVQASQNGTSGASQLVGIAVYGGIVRRCVASYNYGDGISGGSVMEANESGFNRNNGIVVFGTPGTTVGNSSHENGAFGAFLSNALYGGNVFFGNTRGDTTNDGGNVSQNNNSCSGTQC